MASAPEPEGRASPAAPHGHAEAKVVLSQAPGGGALERVTRTLAGIGGVFLLLSVVISIVSISGRYALGLPVPGDYELVELVCAVAVFLFFPYTHAIGGNLTAEFFTSGLPGRWRIALDAVHDVIFALIAALLAWRLGAGMLDKIHHGDTSLLIRVPLWWPYTVAVACMWLLCVVAIWRVLAAVGALRR